MSQPKIANQVHASTVSTVTPQKANTPQHRSLHHSKLALTLAILSFTCSSWGMGSALAAPNITVLNLIEHSSSSPASMCFTFSQGQSVLNDTDNLSKLIELRRLTAAEAASAAAASAATSTTGSSQVEQITDRPETTGQSRGATISGVGKLIESHAAVDQGLLCVSGLEHGGHYELTLKQGLAFTSGNKLNADLKVPFTISDATAQIKLPYNIVLPKNAQNTSFNVQTINQPSFKIAIYKLSTRSLNQLNLQQLLQNELSTWTLRSLLSDSAHKVYERVFNLTDNSSVELNSNLAQHTTVSKTKELGRGGSTANPNVKPSDAQIDAEQKALNAALTAKLRPEQKNQAINTTIALKDFVRRGDDGMYILIAADPRLDLDDLNNYYSFSQSALPLSAKLMMITDLGLSTYKSTEGILVNVRSLTTAQAMPGVHLSLVAQNNELLATAITDEQGTARFPRHVVSGKNALAAHAIVATHDQDTYSLDLQSAPLYLEDNKGAHNSNNILYNDPAATMGQEAYETFAYTERGIYRAGESVHYTALVRNSKLQGVSLPLTIKVMGPYGNEMVKELLTSPKMGGYEYDFTIPQGTPHGSYSVLLQLGDHVLQRTPFTIGSFVPTQINSSFLNTETQIPLNTPFKLRSESNFNYGSHASNLQGLFTVSLHPDPQPVPKEANAANNKFLDEFHFGPDERRYSELTQVDQYYELKTDAEGVLQQDITLKPSEYPRLATVTSTVFDPNQQRLEIAKDFKVAFNQPLIGVRLLKGSNATAGGNGGGSAEPRPLASGSGAAPSAATTSFALCSYMQDGSTFPQDVKYYLYKEFTDYNYVYENGNWQFVRFVGRNLVAQGDVRVDNQKLNEAAFSADLQDGSYVLELESDKSRTTYSFVKGFASSTDALTPDRIALYSDQEQYQRGQTATLSFDSPFDGYANLALGSSGISDFKTFKVKRGHNTVQVEITDALYPQGHALLSIFSPLPNVNQNGASVEGAKQPIRAVGLCDLNLNMDAHKLQVSTNAPDEIKPESTLELTVSATPMGTAATKGANGSQVDAAMRSNAMANEQVSGYAKVTLVDNGVLGLTNYQSPDPNTVLMQDHAYDVNLYDAYGYLMRNPKQQGQGYGGTAEKAMLSMAEAAAALEAIPFKTVALASKIVPLNANGQAQVSFDVPAFSGSVKVMTVAWNDTQSGASADDVMVRDQAVASLGLPRFLNVGDQAMARLNLHNLKAKDPNFKIDISCSGSLKCSYQSISNLKPGLREDHFFNLRTYSPEQNQALGVGQIHLKVINPEFNVQQSYDLTVTSPQLPLLKNYVELIPAGGSKTIPLDNFTQLSGVALSKSLLPNVNPTAYVAQIDRYGYYSIGDLIAALESKLLYGSLLVATPESTESDGADTASDVASATVTAQQADRQKRDRYDNLSPQLNDYKPYRSQAELNAHIQELILRLLSRENAAGGFFGSSNYFNAYATQVLFMAKEKGFVVNDDALQRAVQNLRLNCKNFYGDGAASYANEVLSLGESINQSNLRFALDEKQVKAPVMLAHLANALWQVGDQSRAREALKQASSALLSWQQLLDELSKVAPTDRSERYQLLDRIASFNVIPETDLRHDAFVVLDACLRAGMQEQVTMLLSKLRVLQETPDYLSTMSMAAMLRANAHLSPDSKQGVDTGSFLLTDEHMQALVQKTSVQGTLSAVPSNAQGESVPEAAPTGNTDVKLVMQGTQGKLSAPAPEQATSTQTQTAITTVQPSTATKPAFEIKDGKLVVYNHGKSPIFATTSVLGQYEHDSVIANNGIKLSVNYFNRDGNLDVSTYTFRPNEELLMEINFTKEVASNSSPIVKVKLPAGFEFVRQAHSNDPSFGSLIGDATVYSPEDLQVSDDMLVAKYSRYLDADNISLFVVLRAAHSGTYSQGEAQVQLQSNPQHYGSVLGTTPLKIGEAKN